MKPSLEFLKRMKFHSIVSLASPFISHEPVLSWATLQASRVPNSWWKSLIVYRVRGSQIANSPTACGSVQCYLRDRANFIRISSCMRYIIFPFVICCCEDDVHVHEFTRACYKSKNKRDIVIERAVGAQRAEPWQWQGAPLQKDLGFSANLKGMQNILVEFFDDQSKNLWHFICVFM